MVANCAGLELPGTETGEPFGSPTQPAINRECDCANDMKKTRARLISLRKHPGFQSRRQILLTREEYSPGLVITSTPTANRIHHQRHRHCDFYRGECLRPAHCFIPCSVFFRSFSAKRIAVLAARSRAFAFFSSRSSFATDSRRASRLA